MTPPSRSIDWEAVRRRLAERRGDLDRAFDGRGAWADEVLRRRTGELARLPPVDRNAARPLLIVRGARVRYGLDLARLVRVVPLPRVTPVPGGRTELLGIIAVGGRVMRLFDGDRLCGEGEATRPLDGIAVVFRLTRPAAVRFLAAEDVVERDLDPDTAAGAPAGPFIRRMTADRIALLDMDALAERLETTEEP